VLHLDRRVDVRHSHLEVEGLPEGALPVVEGLLVEGLPAADAAVDATLLQVVEASPTVQVVEIPTVQVVEATSDLQEDALATPQGEAACH